jgi:hypothetical protein
MSGISKKWIRRVVDPRHSLVDLWREVLRLAGLLLNLIRGCARISGRTSLDESDLSMVIDVGLSLYYTAPH